MAFMNDDNGISWFRKALKETLNDVKPLKDKNKNYITNKQTSYKKQSNKTNPNTSSNVNKSEKTQIKYKPINKNLENYKKIEIPFLYTGEIEINISPECHIEYKDPSLSSKIFKEINNNKFHLDNYLDLHGFTVSQSAELTREFIELSLNNNYRFIKIITGKGHAKLKNYLIHWLDEIPYILAYTTAPIKHGGKGAFIIYLKKS